MLGCETLATGLCISNSFSSFVLRGNGAIERVATRDTDTVGSTLAQTTKIDVALSDAFVHTYILGHSSTCTCRIQENMSSCTDKNGLIDIIYRLLRPYRRRRGSSSTEELFARNVRHIVRTAYCAPGEAVHLLYSYE